MRHGFGRKVCAHRRKPPTASASMSQFHLKALPSPEPAVIRMRGSRWLANDLCDDRFSSSPTEPPLPPVEIWSSDFKRTRETAEELSQVFLGRSEVHLTPLLRERDFGDYELRPAEHSYDEVCVGETETGLATRKHDAAMLRALLLASYDASGTPRVSVRKELCPHVRRRLPRSLIDMLLKAYSRAYMRRSGRATRTTPPRQSTMWRASTLWKEYCPHVRR